MTVRDHVLALDLYQHILTTPLGIKNLAIMVDPSNPSNMVLHEESFDELMEDYMRESLAAAERLFILLHIIGARCC